MAEDDPTVANLEQQRKALAHLEAKWQNKVCTVCMHNEWQLGDVAELRSYIGGGLALGGGLYPVVPVICSNCGNTLLFNAIVAGVLGPEDAPGAADGEADRPDEGKRE